MRKKLSKGIIAAAILTTCLSSPFVSAETYSDKSALNGAAINNDSGAVVDVEAGSIFNNNTSTAQNQGGGAIYNWGGTINIGDGTSFTNNHLNQPITNTTDGNYRSAGGAIASWNSGTLNIGKDVIFSGNGTNSLTGQTAWSSGGAIYADTNTTTLAGVTIGEGTSFINNKAGSLGGAVYLGDAKTSITSATFSDNKAGSWGGAIFNAQYFNISGNELAVNGNTLFSNNEAGKYGGAIASQYTSLKVGDASGQVTFDGNKAGIDGGAIHISTDSDPGYEANSEFVNTTFTNNTAQNGSGGAIFNPAADMSITDCLFGTVLKDDSGNVIGAKDGNSAALNGGAIYNAAGNVTFAGTNEFGGNKASQGGAVANLGDGGLVNFGDNAIFAYNEASSVGGAISTVDTGSGKTVVGDNAQFVGNTSGMQGGAVHNQRANTEIGDGAKFYNNTAIGYGGGAIYQDTDDTDSSVTVGDNAEFIGNKTNASHGGAIMNFNASNNATVTVGDNAKFENNTAAKTGGAVANWGGGAEVGANSSFKNNTAQGDGGAIYNADYAGNDASLKVSGGTIFDGNKSNGKGGAIYNAGAMNLDTSAGDITFTNNTASGIANDIIAAIDSETNITGSKNVSIGSGIETAAGSSLSIGGTASLIIEEGVKGQFAGAVTSDSDAYLVNNGEITLSGVNETATGGKNNSSSANIKNNADLTITGESTSKITNDGNVTVNGQYNGNFTQKDKDSTFTIANGSKVTVSEANTNIEGGTVVIDDKNAITGQLSVADAVKLVISGDTPTEINSDGLILSYDETDPTKVKGSIKNNSTSSINLSGVNGGNSKYTVLTNADGEAILGASVILSNAAINASTDVEITINDKMLTLSDNAVSDNGYIVGSDGTLKLAPSANGSLTLTDKNNVKGEGEVLVNEIVIQEQTYNKETDSYETKDIHYGVGTVNIANDNSEFTGNFLQKMGNVIAQAGSKFFGGSNKVEGGALTLQNGAILTESVEAAANANGGYGTINVYNDIEGTVGDDGVNRISADDIANGIDSAVLKYINADGSDSKEVNVTAAGLGLFDGTRVEGDLTLAADGGVRDLTFGNGSGSEAEKITLGDNTKLTYKDNAYIRDDSTVDVGKKASLNFANETTNIEYRPVITAEDATALIAKTGAGETVISSTLKDFHGSVDVGGGSLELANTDEISIGNITANNGSLHIAADTTAKNINVSGGAVTTDKALTAKDLNVTGTKSVINLKGASQFENVNLTDGTLVAANDLKVTDVMNIGSASSTNPTVGTPTISLVNGGVNTVNVGTLNMNTNADIAFDLDPRSQAIDSIIADNIFNNSDSKLLITGINMTRSPIDRNVAIDISNLLKDSSGSKSDMVALPEGGIITRTAMGDYAITSTSSSNMFNAALLAINPQMYRAQVATLASWQNQLVVNNMMFDHMQVVTRQLMDDAKTANKYSAILPQFAPYQYSAKDGNLWYKAYGNFERLSMTRGLSVGNNAYGSLIGADFPLIDLKNGWKIVPTAYVGYNGGHQTYDGVSMYQNGAQLGLMGTAYKGDFLTSLLVYGGGYGNDMSVKGSYGSGSDTTGNWFAGVASKTAYNIHLPHDFIFQPTAMVTYNAFGSQNWGSSFGAMSMNAGMLNGINAAPGFNLIWNKKTFSIYATAQMVYNIMGGVDGRAGNVDLGYVRMRHSYFEYGFGVMKRFKDTFNGYLQMTFRNGGRTGVGFQGGVQWKPGKDKK